MSWKNKTGSTGSDAELIHEYMKEKFQILSEDITILDILQTIISPENAETNSVTQNQIACASRKVTQAGRRKRESEAEALKGKFEL